MKTFLVTKNASEKESLLGKFSDENIRRASFALRIPIRDFLERVRELTPREYNKTLRSTSNYVDQEKMIFGDGNIILFYPDDHLNQYNLHFILELYLKTYSIYNPDTISQYVEKMDYYQMRINQTYREYNEALFQFRKEVSSLRYTNFQMFQTILQEEDFTVKFARLGEKIQLTFNDVSITDGQINLSYDKIILHIRAFAIEAFEIHLGEIIVIDEQLPIHPGLHLPFGRNEILNYIPYTDSEKYTREYIKELLNLVYFKGYKIDNFTEYADNFIETKRIFKAQNNF